MRTAQEIVTTHIPAEWRADARAPGVIVKMAQPFANAMQAAGGATTAPGAFERAATPRRGSTWATLRGIFRKLESSTV